MTVNYRVYGREMTVRNNWIESGFAMLNGAPTFISMVGGTSRPHEVQIELAAGWKASATPLTQRGRADMRTAPRTSTRWSTVPFSLATP